VKTKFYHPNQDMILTELSESYDGLAVVIEENTCPIGVPYKCAFVKYGFTG
jgi:hypothetical protein